MQCYSHFGHHLCSDLGSSDPSATRLCQSSVHIHVVLLPEAPCQARGKIRRSQCAMHKCMQFRNGCKELCTIFLIANVQGPVQLSHPETHLFLWNGLLWKKQVGFHSPKISQDLVCYLRSFMTLDGSLSSNLFSGRNTYASDAACALSV